MVDNNTPHVKNPLTIIAVFAGITEVSGTGVIAFLGQVQQEIFVWFLVLFPTLLVVLFFLTLNLNPKVLYAPSDFKNEDNFLKVHKYDPATQELIIKKSPVAVQKVSSESSVQISEMVPFHVAVSNFPDAQSFIEKISNDVYSVGIYEPERSLSSFRDHEAIWVGQEVQPEKVVRVLKKAVEYYPHLKYLHISGDGGIQPPDEIHYQMYIGGATSTAKGYNIRAFDPKDIFALPENISKEKLHKFIRSYY